MKESDRDRQLNIKTSGLHEMNEWNHTHYNRTESTSYQVLDVLRENFQFKENDHLLDFGSGKGRVLFYIHFHATIPVTGIEVSSTIFQQLEENKRLYLSKHPNTVPINLVNHFAEHYPIHRKFTVFYFFNPFSGTIFRQVLENIIQSIEEHPRSIRLIIYFPMPSYHAHLELLDLFELEQTIKIGIESGFTDEIIILTNKYNKGA